MNMNIELQVFGFTGFYQGLWDQGENEYDQISNLKYGDDEGIAHLKMLEDWGFPDEYRSEVAKLFADEYADMVEEAFGIGAKLVKSEVCSPREYNFTTDKIYVTIEIDDYDKFADKLKALIVDKEYHDELKKIVHDNHTSYDGFISFMSNDLDEWTELIEDPNNENYVSCIVGYLLSLICHDKFYALNDSIYEYVQCNTDLHNVQPNTEIAKDEWSLYEKYESVYIDFANENEIKYPNEKEWSDYKNKFLEYAEEREKERNRKEEDDKYPYLPGFEPDYK